MNTPDDNLLTTKGRVQARIEKIGDEFEKKKKDPKTTITRSQLYTLLFALAREGAAIQSHGVDVGKVVSKKLEDVMAPLATAPRPPQPPPSQQPDKEEEEEEEEMEITVDKKNKQKKKRTHPESSTSDTSPTSMEVATSSDDSDDDSDDGSAFEEHGDAPITKKRRTVTGTGPGGSAVPVRPPAAPPRPPRTEDNGDEDDEDEDEDDDDDEDEALSSDSDDNENEQEDEEDEEEEEEIEAADCASGSLEDDDEFVDCPIPRPAPPKAAVGASTKKGVEKEKTKSVAAAPARVVAPPAAAKPAIAAPATAPASRTFEMIQLKATSDTENKVMPILSPQVAAKIGGSSTSTHHAFTAFYKVPNLENSQSVIRCLLEEKVELLNAIQDGHEQMQKKVRTFEEMNRELSDLARRFSFATGGMMR